jgi:hypothetical protein
MELDILPLRKHIRTPARSMYSLEQELCAIKSVLFELSDIYSTLTMTSSKTCDKCSGKGKIHTAETLAHEDENCLWCDDW